MIRKVGLKRLIAQVLAVVGTVVLLGALALAGRLVTYSLSGAKTAQALHEVPEVPEGVAEAAEWLPDRWTRERRLEPGTRRLVQAAYLQAWEALGRYQQTCDGAMVTQWFAGPARQQALGTPCPGQRQLWAVRHRLALTFYALDGATVALQDQGVDVVRRFDADGAPTVTVARETYDVVLTLEDGYWRVRQYRLQDSVPGPTVSQTAAGTPEGAGRLLVDGVAAAAPRRLRGTLRAVRVEVRWLPAVPPTDAEPAGRPVSFDDRAVRRDLDAVRALGLDAVRIDLPPAEPGEVPAPSTVRAVRDVLDLAQRRGLRVEVTLDGPGTDRGPGTWTVAERRVAAVVAGLHDHPALALWNLYEAPESAPSPRVDTVAWLLRAAALVRRSDPRTPATIAWSTPGAAVDPVAVRAVDVVTLPWQGRPEQVPSWLGAVRAAGPERTVVLAPVSDSRAGLLPGGRTEAEQAYWTGRTLAAAGRAGVRDVVVPRLRDAPARVPLLGDRAGARGLLRPDGSVKPVVGALLGLPGAGAEPGRLDVLRKPFWWLAASAVLLSVPGVPRRARRALTGAGRRVRRRGRTTGGAQSR